MSSSPARPKPTPRWLRMTLMLAGATSVPFFFIAACQSKLIYYPRPYPPATVQSWQKITHGQPIDFTTSQGQQRAFLQGKLDSPRNLWIVCGGNGTVALDWASWLGMNAPREDAWLLIDFPGYGACEGKPSPASIRESFQKAIPLAVQKAGLPPSDPSRLRIFGHSLGAAACLIAASDFHINNGVIVSPFTSTMDMSRELIGVPLGFLVTHRFDNAARLDELIARGPTHITILHGTDDEVIPITMARTLAHNRTPSVHLIEIPGARHNNIPDAHPKTLANALHERGGALQAPSP